MLLSFPLMSSCLDEPAQPQSVNEIVTEISGDWYCNIDENGFPLEFNATISADPSSESRILITNFHNTGNDIKVSAVVSKDLTIEIPEQAFNNQIFRGSGLISDDYTEITWNYTVEDENGDITSVTGKYTYRAGA